MTGLIYQQIPKVMADIEAIAKSRPGPQGQYKFRGIDDVYNEVHSIFSKHKIFTTPEVLDIQRSEKPTKSGGLSMYSVMRVKFKFYAEDGSFVEVITAGEGMDSGDKASNKAMAVAHKYAIMQTFVIPTIDDKDPENDDHDLEPTFDFKMPIGSQKGKMASSIGVEGIQGALKWAQDTDPKKFKDFIANCEKFLAAQKQQPEDNFVH